jgi:hypothetical protein
LVRRVDRVGAEELTPNQAWLYFVTLAALNFSIWTQHKSLPAALTLVAIPILRLLRFAARLKIYGLSHFSHRDKDLSSFST